MRRATVAHAVLVGGWRMVGDRPAAAWVLRDLLRFGVTRATLLEPAPDGALLESLLHAVDLLPKRLDVALGEIAAPLPERVLLAHADMLAEANLARLLADAAEDPADVPRLLVPAGTQAFGGVAVVPGGLAPLLGAADPVAALLAASGVRVSEVAGRFLNLADPLQARLAGAESGALSQRPALFLDRDGVLNHDHAYVGTQDRWEWVAGAREAVRFATDHGWHVFVASNQSGVARGYYTEAQAEALLDWAADECRRAGGTIDDWRVCPYLPDAPVAAYRRQSDWRKPAPGMLNHLVASWGLDPAHGIMLGDRATDAEAGRAAGMRAEIFPGGNLLDFVRPLILERGVAKAPGG